MKCYSSKIKLLKFIRTIKFSYIETEPLKLVTHFSPDAIICFLEQGAMKVELTQETTRRFI